MIPYRISGLSPQPFTDLFALDHATLAARGMCRVVADAKPGYPCRVTLEDAEPGETLLLLPYEHQPAGEYRASGPIFVRASARRAAQSHNAIPEQQRSRLLSVRAYGHDGWMHDADICEGEQLEALIQRFFANPAVDYLHVHYARRGCYACRVDRG